MVGASIAIANAALTFLGESPLTSTGDDVPAAEVVADQWAAIRKAEISAHPWIFAATRVELGADGSAPVFGWERSFTLPADFLRLLELPDLNVAWWGRTASGEAYALDRVPGYEIEGSKLLSDAAAPLKLRYIADIDDHALWPALFGEVMTYRLAMVMAELVTQSTARYEKASVEYDRALARAKRNNAIQKPPRFLRDVSPWEMGRGTGLVSW